MAQPIDLIPRIQEWIAMYNPGLPVAVSEYNWGYEKEKRRREAREEEKRRRKKKRMMKE